MKPEDFKNQKHIVLGITEGIDYQPILDLYQQYYPEAEISCCTTTESEFMKIFVNSFYAQKVQIFNEFYQLCQRVDNCEYQNISELMLKNGWINPMHTQVPGPDGLPSYGGACFPKDTNALLHFMKKKIHLIKF